MSEIPKQVVDQTPNAVAQIGDVDNSRAESLKLSPVTMIDVRRHSEYEAGFPKAGWGKPSQDEAERLGHLTPEGYANAHRTASELVARRMEQTRGNIDFLVVASPTFWLGDDQLGQRAIETAKVYSDEITKALQDSGMSEVHLLNLNQRPTSQHEVGNVRISDKVVEAQLFDNPEAQLAIEGLRKKYNGQGKEFWDAWYEGADNEALVPFGLETSTDASDRASKLINALIRYGEKHSATTGRSLEVVVVTHHEVLQPYALHNLGISTEDFAPDKNGGFEIEVKDGRAIAKIAGYEVDLSEELHRDITSD